MRTRPGGQTVGSSWWVTREPLTDEAGHDQHDAGNEGEDHPDLAAERTDGIWPRQAEDEHPERERRHPAGDPQRDPAGDDSGAEEGDRPGQHEDVPRAGDAP